MGYVPPQGVGITWSRVKAKLESEGAFNVKYDLDKDGYFDPKQLKGWKPGYTPYITPFEDDAVPVEFDWSSAKIMTVQRGIISTAGLNGAFGVFVKGDYAYVAALDADALTIIDISDPTSPTQVGTISTADLSGAFGVFVRGDYAYVTGGIADALTIIDISDPTSPTQVSTISAVNLDGARDVFVKGDYAYVTAGIADSLTIIG